MFAIMPQLANAICRAPTPTAFDTLVALGGQTSVLVDGHKLVGPMLFEPCDVDSAYSIVYQCKISVEGQSNGLGHGDDFMHRFFCMIRRIEMHLFVACEALDVPIAAHFAPTSLRMGALGHPDDNINRSAHRAQ